MSLGELQREDSRPERHKYVFAEKAISGLASPLIAYGSNADVTVVAGIAVSSTAVGDWHLVDAGAVWSAAAHWVEEEYDPAMVTRILEADAKPPEAKFSNVIDMLEWLERE
jgi:hypothetical protein